MHVSVYLGREQKPLRSSLVVSRCTGSKPTDGKTDKALGMHASYKI